MASGGLDDDVGAAWNEAQERAARRVAQELRYPNQLNTIEQLKLQKVAKKSAVDTRLKTVLHAQRDDITRGLDLLCSALDDIDTVRTNFSNVETQYNACRELEEYIEESKRLSDARDGLRATWGQIELIFNVPDDVASVLNDIHSGEANLLEVHEKLSGMENCRDTLLSQIAKRSNGLGVGGELDIKARHAVEAYFQSVNDLGETFTQKLLQDLQGPDGMCDPLAVSQSNPKKLVTVLRIIEREERLDEKFLSATGEAVKDLSRFRPKALKKLLFQKLEDAIEIRFDERLNKNINSVPRFLNSFETFYIEELRMAKEDLPSKFPPSYNIFEYYLNQYHNRLYFGMSSLHKNPEIEPNEIMTLLKWVPKYRANMESYLGVDVSRFRKQLLDAGSDGGGEAELRVQYLKLLSGKLDSWSNNLVATEVEPWFVLPEEGKEPFVPELTRDNLFYTDTPKILFSMIDSQIDVAMQPGNGDTFVNGLINLCMKTLVKFKDDLLKSVKRCKDMYFSGMESERPDNLVEYMIANANNMETGIGMVSQMREKLTIKFRETRHSDLESALLSFNGTCKFVINGFRAIGEASCAIIEECMKADLQPQYDVLFTSKWMRSDVPVKTICATIRDYGEEFRSNMSDEYWPNMMASMYKSIILVYVNKFVNPKVSIKNELDLENLMERFKGETDMLKKCFGPFIEDSDLGSRQDYAAVVTVISHLIESPGSMMFPEWNKAKQTYPDITLHHLEAILNVRPDFSAKEVKRLIQENILKKQKDNKKKDGDDEDESSEARIPERNRIFIYVQVPTNTDFSVFEPKKKRGSAVD